MTDYFGRIGGMPAVITVGGPTYTIAVGGKDYRFELPPYCSLCPVNDDDSEREAEWPREVWRAVDLWCEQGQRVEDGKCVWNEPTPDPRPLIHLGGKHYTRDPNVAEAWAQKALDMLARRRARKRK